MKIKQLVILFLISTALTSSSFKAESSRILGTNTHYVNKGDILYIYFVGEGKMAGNEKNNLYFSSIVKLSSFKDQYKDETTDKIETLKKRFSNQILKLHDDDRAEVRQRKSEDWQDLEDFEKKWLEEKRDRRYNIYTIQL